MSQSDIKPWERPWTTEEMINNASNWNLAGDSGLLKYLEDFSERMFSKVKDTNDRLNDLIDSADATNLALQNAINKFMGLRNTQFIESRVYEDDETLPTKQTLEKEEKPKPTEAERLEEMKQAICNGLEIIDKYYEKVEIPESDSEDDTDGPNILYRPIDPYIDRPLPYVIGTSEWHKYWHVGLGHSSSDSEVENEQDQFSETESEPEIKNLPERDRTQIPGISDSESEDIPKNKMSKPVANSTFNDNTNTNRNMFDSSSDSETGSLPPQVNTVNSNFAEELATKLGQVKSDIQPEVNTKPIKKQPTSIPGGLFSDEPPPLDDDDIFTKKNINSGLFAAGDNLFDDVDDADFWKGPATKSTISTITKPKDDLFAEEDEQDNEIFSEKKTEKPVENVPQKKPTGLFDEDDDELFNTSIAQPKKPFLVPFNTTAPLVSEDPPEIEPSVTKPQDQHEEVKKKKPIGGVNVLGAALQQHIRKTRPPSSSESEYDSEPSKPQTLKSEPIKSAESLKKDEPLQKEEPLKKEEPIRKEAPFEAQKKEISSIFDDASPLFSDDLFNTSSTKKFTSNLFDPEPINDDVLFKVEDKKEEPKDSSKFEDRKQEPAKKIEKSILFVDEPPPISKKTLLFDNEDEEDLFSSKPKPETKSDNSKLFSKTTGSIFDDLGDDLFSSKLNVPSKSKIDLFDPNPPELDESDNKSESQVSLDNEPSSYGSGNICRASLFDTEPPMLSNESSGIVRDQSNSRFEEDSSFYPYLTSSRRHSDLFQDQTDSLLTTKNKISGGESIQNLGKISENESVTKIDITPSGNESSLINNSDNSVVQSKTSIIFDDTDLFPKNKPENPNTKPISLFGDGEPGELFKKPEPVQQKSDNSFKDSHKFSKKKNTSLFADSESDDDLFSNKSSGSKNSSASDILNNSSKSAKTLKNKNIFEDELFVPNTDGVPDVDIFKNKNLENSSSDEFNTKSDKNDEIFEQKEESTVDDSKKFNYEENLKSDEVKTDPKKSLSFEKNVEPEMNEEKEETDGQILSTGSSPRKLRHSLNINVAALLPGSSPPRKQNLEKSISLDSSDNNQNVAAIEEKAKSAEKISEPKTGIEKSISFDQPINTEEILISANKERVKIPIKRRPSSRRARHEAIRKSEVDLNYEDTITENDQNVNESPSDRIETQNILNIANNNITKTQKEEEKIKNPLLNPLSPSTDEEDFLSMPRDEDLSSENFNDSLFGKAPIISPVNLSDDNKRNIKTDIFNTVSSKEEIKSKPQDIFSDSEDIFTQKKPFQPKKADTSIFSSSDSENDLFSTPKTELKKPDNNNLIASPDEDLFKPVVSSQAAIPKSKLLTREDSLFEDDDIFSSKKIPPKSVIIKKSLFDEDDDDDGDDIFGSSAASTAKPIQSQSTTMKKAPVSSRVKKLSSDAVQDLDDPLEALKK